MGLFIYHKFFGVGKIENAVGAHIEVSFINQEGEAIRQKISREIFDGYTVRPYFLPKGTPCIVNGVSGLIHDAFKIGDNEITNEFLIPTEYLIKFGDGRKIRVPDSDITLQELSKARKVENGEVIFGPGVFIWTKDEYRLGKLVQIDGKGIIAEFFHSIGKTEQRTYGSREWTKGYLYPNTRVYWCDKDNNWRIGLVKGWHISDRRIIYEVAFPNGVKQFCPENSLYVRCLSAETHPSEIMACGGIETQYFHDHRTRFIKCNVDQRRVMQGMSAALSSSIELVPHQLNAARRVLSDPIQRYLLADEVGLGKTIEAGIIIRQVLIDHPECFIAVLVPESLTSQWQEELWIKFRLHQFNYAPKILPYSKVGELKKKNIELLVVDEAHHIFESGEWADDLTKVARASHRLLLLSAAPVTGHEKTLLKMLRVLDPDVYDQDTPESFSTKVAKRTEFGALARTLRRGTRPTILRLACTRAKEIIGDDNLAMKLIEELENAIAKGDQSVCDDLTEHLRSHIAETYRIYHRLIRNRRKDLPDWVIRPRVPKPQAKEAEKLGHIQIVELDNDVTLFFAEQWNNLRLAALNSLPDARDEALENSLIKTCARLFEGLGSGPSSFLKTFEAIKSEGKAIVKLPDFFPIYQSCIEAFKENPIPFERDAERAIKTALNMISSNQNTEAFCVSFVSCEKIAAELRKNIFRDAEDQIQILGQKEDEDINNESDDEKTCVLILGPSGEEGCNIQNAEVIIHLDLPLDPMRVEQRIGRLDRFGRRIDGILHVILLPVNNQDSPWRTWFDLLAEGYRVFNEPISDVQFLLEKESKALRRSLFFGGAHGIRDYGKSLHERIEEERRKLDDQYALDLRLEREEESDAWFEALDENDSDDFENFDSVEGWICDALGIERKYCEEGRSKRVYSWRKMKTRIPQVPWQEFIDGGLEKPARFSRRKAIWHEDSDLVRIGHPILDVIERFSRWDTRGVAFATWRSTSDLLLEEQPWLGFKLFFVIEADLRKLERDVRKYRDWAMMRRRADYFLPPWHQTIYLDQGLHEVTDENLLDILSLSKENNKTKDKNLGSRQEILFNLIDPAEFELLASKAEKEGRELIRNSHYFQKQWGENYDKASSRIALRRERFEGHVVISKSEPSVQKWLKARREEIRLDELILESVAVPDIRLLSIGFFVLADKLPRETR
jgi:ATP-dependent helicase HepA